MILDGRRLRTIVGLSLPIALILLLHNLMTLTGIALVGPLGDAAVAGIGIAGALVSMLVALLFGIDTGVQAMVARRFGGGEIRDAGAVLVDGLAIATGAGIVLMAVGYGAGPALLPLVNDHPEVIEQALAYLKAGLPMLPFVGASLAFSAYRNGTGAPRYSLLAVMAQFPCYALLGYAFVFGALGLSPLGTAGLGLAAAFASFVGVLVHVIVTGCVAPIPGLVGTRPSWSGSRLLLRIGLPIGLQQSLVNVGVMITLAIVGLIGTEAVAAMNVLLVLMLMSILPASGMGVAAATLVGTALGRNDPGDARRWGWQVATLGALALLAPCLSLVIAPHAILGLFVADPAMADLAAPPLRLLAIGMSIDAFGRILGFALRGAGATPLVASLAFLLQWAVQLPLVWWAGVYLGLGLTGIAAVRLALFAVETAILALLWRSDFWSCPRPDHAPAARVPTGRVPTPPSSR
jgi:multidrug resistance protein, MATE family